MTIPPDPKNVLRSVLDIYDKVQFTASGEIVVPDSMGRDLSALEQAQKEAVLATGASPADLAAFQEQILADFVTWDNPALSKDAARAQAREVIAKQPTGHHSLRFESLHPFLQRAILASANLERPHATTAVLRWLGLNATVTPERLARRVVSGALELHIVLAVARRLTPAIVPHLVMGKHRYPVRMRLLREMNLTLLGPGPIPPPQSIRATMDCGLLLPGQAKPYTVSVHAKFPATVGEALGLGETLDKNHAPNENRRFSITFQLQTLDVEEQMQAEAQAAEWSSRAPAPAVFTPGVPSFAVFTSTQLVGIISPQQIVVDPTHEVDSPQFGVPVPAYPVSIHLPQKAETTIPFDETTTTLLPLVRAFFMENKVWGYVDPRDLQPLVPDAKALHQVRLPEGWREALSLLTAANTAGLAILAVGAPGVGKTATARALAAGLGRPIYDLDLGELTPGQFRGMPIVAHMASSFEVVLGRVSRWGAVLLIEEAEVLLPDRRQMPQAMTSQFLRAFDRLPSLVVLTTNLPERLDPAVRSRVALLLPFPDLDADARRWIWTHELTEAEQAELTPAVVDELVKLPLDGRRIHNLVCALRATGMRAANNATFRLLAGAPLSTLTTPAAVTPAQLPMTPAVVM